MPSGRLRLLAIAGALCLFLACSISAAVAGGSRGREQLRADRTSTQESRADDNNRTASRKSKSSSKKRSKESDEKSAGKSGSESSPTFDQTSAKDQAKWSALQSDWLDRPPAEGIALPVIKKPNIVFILVDDEALSDQFIMKKTNALLGEGGETFRNAYATEPLCCPARATLLTGQYSHNNHVLSNRPPYGSISAFEGRDNTLPIWMKAAGYRTGFVGKYMNGPAPKVPEPGWDSWVSDADATRYAMYDYTFNVDGQYINYGHQPKDYKTQVETRYAKDFIAESAPSPDPFFLTWFAIAPHDDNTLPAGTPDPLPSNKYEGSLRQLEFPRPRSYNEKGVKDKASYNQVQEIDRARAERMDNKRRWRLESLRSVDDAVEKIDTQLQNLGELDNTLIVFTSDNGYMFGEHRLGSKSKPYQESVRIPLLIRGPGFEKGVVRDDLVALHDLTKTFTTLGGASPGRVLDGRSLTRDTQRNELLLECPACETNLSAGWQALVTHHDSFFRYNDGQEESYDLDRDPGELSGKPDPRTAALSARLDQVSKCQGSFCP